MHTPSVFLLAGLSLATPICHGQAVVGKPCLFSDYFAEWRTFPSILRDPEGNLACGRHRLNNGGATQGPPAAGDPVATAVRRTERNGPQGHFTYRDRSGNIQDLWFDRYREKDRWHVDQLNNGGLTLAPAAAGEPNGTTFRGAFHVTYRDLSGGIQALWHDRAWHTELLNQGGATGAPMAAGDPVQVVHRRRRHVLYRDVLGSLQDLWFDGAWHAVQVNNGGATQAPVAVGNPCARVVNGSIRHVTYRDLAGNLQDLWHDGTWHVERLNAGGATEAPLAASDPVSLVPPSNWEYVAYVDIQGNAQLLSKFQDKPWRTTWLNAPDLRFWGGVFLPVTDGNTPQD